MPPDDKNFPALDALQRRIDDAESGAPARNTPPAAEDASGFAAVSQTAIELLAGIGVGLGIGWMLDRWLGTAPWLMLACFFLGAAAGFFNLKRAADRLDKAP